MPRHAVHRTTSRRAEPAETTPPPRAQTSGGAHSEPPDSPPTLAETDPMVRLEALRACARARSQAAFNAIAGFDVDKPDTRGRIRWTEDGPERIPMDESPHDLARKTQARRERARWNGPGAEEAALIASLSEPICDEHGCAIYWPVGELHVIHPENKLAAFMRDVHAQEQRWAREKRDREALIGEA